MAISKMTRARIAVHKTVATDLALELQKLSACEFIKKTEVSEPAIDLTFVREKLQKAKSIFKTLESFETTRPDSFAMMMGEMPEETLQNLLKFSCDYDIDTLYASTLQADKNLKESNADLMDLKTKESQLLKFTKIPYPLDFFNSGTGTTKGFIYEISKAKSHEFKSGIETTLQGLCECTLISGSEKASTDLLVVVAPQALSGAIIDCANEVFAYSVNVESWMKLTATDELSNIRGQIASLEGQIQKYEADIAKLADDNLPKLRKVYDSYNILISREEAKLSGEPTEQVFVWDVWVLTSALNKVQKIVSSFANKVVLEVIEPEEGELPPTSLKNPSFASCMEPLTMMYGAPTYGTPDPCMMMAPFFFLIFGVCFGDAGYGLLLSAVVGYFLIRHKMPPLPRKIFIVLLAGMLATVVVGLVTGSVFGDALTAFSFLSPIASPLQKVQLLDPMKDPMTFLGISLVIGVTQIVVGLLIAMVHSWRNGDKFSAIFDHGAWITFLLGLICFAVFSSIGTMPMQATICKYISIVSAVALVLTQGREKKNIFMKLVSGILSLYDITGYFGDILSYSRLLALGLSGAAVGMVINLLVNMVLPIKYYGWILAILIFIFGHGFSIAVNILGAFVHDLRLQFVEFFGKFYEAGGREFAPLSINTKFTKISK